MAMAAAAQATGDEFLELRERLKHDIRNKRMKQTQQVPQSSSALRLSASATAFANYGSFFGPSLSSVAPRIIQECKLLLQNPNLENAEKVKVPPSKPKAEVIKASRDYSFLSSDETPTPAPVESVSSPSEPAMESEEGLVRKNAKEKTKVWLKNNKVTQLVSRKQVVSRNINGPAQPSGPKSLAIHYFTRGKLIPKERPTEKLGRTAMVKAQPKKRRLEECPDSEEISKLIRGMYGYNPQKYGKDDCDDRNMEANLHDIQKEEQRSAKLAKKEDDEELQKILQEERESMKKKKKNHLRK